MNFAVEKPDLWNKTDFVFEKAKNPLFPPVLPNPLLLTPPNGKFGFAYCSIQSLMAAVPELVYWRNLSILTRDLLNKYNAKDFSLLLINSKTESKLSYLTNGNIGPKISFFIMVFSSLTFFKTVNGKLCRWLDSGEEKRKYLMPSVTEAHQGY